MGAVQSKGVRHCYLWGRTVLHLACHVYNCTAWLGVLLADANAHARWVPYHLVVTHSVDQMKNVLGPSKHTTYVACVVIARYHFGRWAVRRCVERCRDPQVTDE